MSFVVGEVDVAVPVVDAKVRLVQVLPNIAPVQIQNLVSFVGRECSEEVSVIDANMRWVRNTPRVQRDGISC